MNSGPRPVLTRTVIAATALAALDERGEEALTLREVARGLDVKASSLYNHVRSKSEILDLVTELISSEVDLSLLHDEDWREALRGFAVVYRKAFLAHPNAAAVIAHVVENLRGCQRLDDVVVATDDARIASAAEAAGARSLMTPEIFTSGTDRVAWAARELGAEVTYMSEATREEAESVVVHGSIEGLTPRQALDTVLATTTLEGSFDDGELRISGGMPE